MAPVSEGVFSREGNEVEFESIVWSVHEFPDKAGTKLKGTGLVAYPVHAVLWNNSAMYRKWLVENGLNLQRC